MSTIAHSSVRSPSPQWPPAWTQLKARSSKGHAQYARKRTIRRPKNPVGAGNTLWDRLVREHEEDRLIWMSIMNEEEKKNYPSPIDCPEWKYLERKVLPTMLPSLEKTLMLAEELGVEEGNEKTFDYIDTLAEFVLNEGRPKGARHIKPLEVPKVLKHILRNPRPEYPKYMTMSEDSAACIIQKYARGWLVRKQPQVQEMIKFWEAIREETDKEKKVPITIDAIDRIPYFCRDITHKKRTKIERQLEKLLKEPAAEETEDEEKKVYDDRLFEVDGRPMKIKWSIKSIGSQVSDSSSSILMPPLQKMDDEELSDIVRQMSLNPDWKWTPKESKSKETDAVSDARGVEGESYCTPEIRKLSSQPTYTTDDNNIASTRGFRASKNKQHLYHTILEALSQNEELTRVKRGDRTFIEYRGVAVDFNEIMDLARQELAEEEAEGVLEESSVWSANSVEEIIEQKKMELTQKYDKGWQENMEGSVLPDPRTWSKTGK